MNSVSNVTEMTSGDVLDKYKAMKVQNRELKALLIEKDNQLNELKRDNLSKQDEIDKMLDPIGKQSVLKTVNN